MKNEMYRIPGSKNWDKYDLGQKNLFAEVLKDRYREDK